VVGYGPVGRTLVRLLRDNKIEATIVEMNLDTVQQLRQTGLAAVYGDAAHRDTLKAAGIERSATLILSASGIRGAEEIIRLARELNPKIRILVRSGYLSERPALRQAGADEVFSGEGEVALAMTESILGELGASPDQIDRERARARAEMFGVASSEAAEPGGRDSNEGPSGS
jgi:CPA2 family monovalent cation:H+ antiporter-2